MLDFVIFAFTAVLGLIILIAVFCLSDGNKRLVSSSSTTAKSPDKIPGWSRPPADDKLGDLPDLRAHGSLHQYLLHRHDNGRCPITAFWLEKQKVVSVCSPDGFKDTRKLTNRPKCLFTVYEPLIGPASIQYANGTDWEQRRKTVYHTLKGQYLDDYFPHFIQIVDTVKSHWSTYCPEKQISLTKECMAMSIKAIFMSCLGNILAGDEEIEQLSQSYHHCFHEFEVSLCKGPAPSGSKREKDLQKHIGIMRELASKALHNQVTTTVHVPFLEALVQSGAPNEQLISDTISFMVGGFHTSGYFLAWMLWYLALHPDVQDCLALEVFTQVKGDRGDKLRFYAHSEQTYMRQVQDETLRLSTLAPYAARYADEDIVVCGFTIPAQTPIIQAIGVAAKNETIWSDVEAFDPGRFNIRRGLEFSLFGVPSQRKCPGFAFTYFEVATFASVLLESFSIEPVSDQVIEQAFGLITTPKDDLDLLVYIKPRDKVVMSQE